MLVRSVRLLMALLVAGVVFGLPVQARAQEALPREIAGVWRITRVLPVHAASACWTDKQAEPLVGSLLSYTENSMRWHGRLVPLTGVTTRIVSITDLAEEAPRGDPNLKMADLGFTGPRIREVNLQHDDADITGATTEVPGDSVLIAGPGRLVLSACGVFLEARRIAPRGVERPQMATLVGPGARSGS